MNLFLRFSAVLALAAVVFALNPRRGEVSWGKMGRLVLFQMIIIAISLKTSWLSPLFRGCALAMRELGDAVAYGTQFVFGYIGGGPSPFLMNAKIPLAPIFMFQILPLLVVMAALTAVLFHWGILPYIVRHISKLTQSLWRIGGALSTAMVAKIFWGQSDVALFVKPYLPDFTRNEWLSFLTVGMCTASAAMFALYAAFLSPLLGSSGAICHILTATLVNIPAGLMLAEFWIPEKEKGTHGKLHASSTHVNALQALSQGALEGWSLMWSIGALMLVSLAVVYILNQAMLGLSAWALPWSVSLTDVMAYGLSPLAWLMGISPQDIPLASTLLAKKTLFNEIIALHDMGSPGAEPLGLRSVATLVYSLCNFSNVSSIAMQIGVMGALAPSRQKEVASLAFTAFLVSCLAGAWSGFLVSLFL